MRPMSALLLTGHVIPCLAVASAKAGACLHFDAHSFSYLTIFGVPSIFIGFAREVLEGKEGACRVR